MNSLFCLFQTWDRREKCGLWSHTRTRLTMAHLHKRVMASATIFKISCSLHFQASLLKQYMQVHHSCEGYERWNKSKRCLCLWAMEHHNVGGVSCRFYKSSSILLLAVSVVQSNSTIFKWYLLWLDIIFLKFRGFVRWDDGSYVSFWQKSHYGQFL